MKTTVRTLVGSIALAIIFSTRTVVAAPLCSASCAWLGTLAVGQSATTSDPADKEQKTADLLRRARQAMSENDLDTAGALIAQAEALGVQYGIFHLGDTPKKARRDLERNRKTSTATPIKPSQIFAPLGLGGSKKTPTTDPFAGKTPNSSTEVGNGQQVMPLPKVAAATPIHSLTAAGSSPMAPPSEQPYRLIAPGENDARAPGATTPVGNAGLDSPLRTARLALAVGDVRRAADSVERAKTMPMEYQPLDDTPEKVEAAIRKYQDLSSLDKNTEAYRRAYARNLMQQADALLRWSELDEAERLAGRAAGMRLLYGPYEQKPAELLQQIAVTRRQGNNRASAPLSAPGYASVSKAPTPTIATHQQAAELVRLAREAVATGQLDRAESLARQAEQLRVPDSAFAPGEDRPGLVLLDLRQLRLREPSSVVPAGAVIPAGGNGQPERTATRAVYNPNDDQTRNVAASNQQSVYTPDPRLAQNAAAPQPTPAYAPIPNSDAAGARTQGKILFEKGEAALKAHDATRAYQFFRQAATRMNELDPITAQRLQDHLQLLSIPSRTNPTQQQTGQAPTMLDEAVARQQALIRQVAADLAHKESNARKMREADPAGALALLEEARGKVVSSGLDSTYRDQLLRRVDRAIRETNQYIEQNRPQIELANRNSRTHEEVDRRQRIKVEVGEKLALLVDEFNTLIDEQRYEEAQVVAKRAAQLDPENPVVGQVLLQAKFVRNLMNAKAIENAAEEGFVNAMGEVDRAKIPFAGDKNPMVFPDAKVWSDLSQSREKLLAKSGRQRSEQDIEIEKKLRTPVSLRFTNAPLSKVLENLAKLAEVNLHLDPQGLAEEGVTSDTPVTIELRNEIMFKSALNLILEPLHLSYVIEDEVLKITSEQMRDGQVVPLTYNVADLVVPIPNFVPTPMGLASAYNAAMGSVGFGGGMPFGSSTTTPLPVVGSRDGKGGTFAMNPQVYAQQMGTAPSPGPMGGGSNVPIGSGPGGLGGGAQADFDSLIELITTTVKPDTWDDVGGPGSIAEFETNLSLVISQTQEVHEEIADLLEQLRRMQDLQVTIEVRFITLNDNFFERIGVSFDFDISDNIDGKGLLFGARQTADPIYSSPADFTINGGRARDVSDQDNQRTVTVGMGAPNMFSADLDIPFTQSSFGLAVPQFGGFDATAGAQLGFAILSDIEAYFFINAAQGDKRSNVLQAPKVTLFNGQQAYVSDTSQSPFVISVIPVVGDFAAAQQPVIVVLSEGTFMTVQAVVSDDKRFVRLTVVPFFSKIGEVNTFQFTGSTTTTTDTTRDGLQSAATDPDKLWNSKDDSTTSTTSGTTVQLPTFSFVTVTTTVSVPDGGTVLLGGIKRLSEGRNEFGVPMLNKLPYINRLFKNVGIGRETQSLMMMVTPRIIIQEEEEEKLGIIAEP